MTDTTLLRRFRWVPAAALAAAAGVMLAAWNQGGVLPGAREASVARASGSTSAASEHAAGQPHAGGAAPAESATADTAPRATVEAGRPEEIERLRDDLLTRARVDAEGALAALMALDPRQRRYLAEEVVRQAVDTAPEAALAWLARNVTDAAERDRLLAAAYGSLADQDPASAMTATRLMKDPEARHTAQQRVLETWSQQDVAAAYGWARSQSGEGSGDMYATVMRAYMAQSPEQAANLVTSLPEGDERRQMIAHYVDGMADSDPLRALDWLTQHGDDSHQDLRANIIERWARESPWEAMEYAAHEVDGETSSQLVSRVAGQLSADQPEALAAGLHRLPRSYQAMAAERLARSWAYSDPQAARQWVESLPAGEARTAASRVLQQVARQDPQAPSE